MKKYLVVLCFALFTQGISAQSLLDIYKKGIVKLTPDSEYGQGNDWEYVFQSYYDTLQGIPGSNGFWIGDRKSIVVAPDGSVVVNHAERDYYSLFDANGKFVKEFGVTNKAGKRLKKKQAIRAVINDKYFTFPNNMGEASLLDFNGNFIKTLNFDYSVLNMIALDNNKIAIVGSVVWSDTKSRELVAIVDCENNQQKIIWDNFKEQKYRYVDSSSKIPNIAFAEDAYTQPCIAYANNEILLALPNTGEILFYDIDGKLKSQQKANYQQKYRSVEDQKNSQRKRVEDLSVQRKKMEASGMDKKTLQRYDALIEGYRLSIDKITEPYPLPIFATVIKDSDGNLLFFEVPEEDGSNQFNVWVCQNGGEFVAKSSFVCDDFDLSITPSKMVFHKGYLYALQTLKKANANPLRLLRFKLGN